ncbi:hypothetical protein ACTFIW_011659 [Dictyostelium discoideum]
MNEDLTKLKSETLQQQQPIDYNEILFWKVFKNNFLKRQIFYLMLNMDIEFQNHSKYFTENRIKFENVYSFKWMIKNDLLDLLKFKLEKNQYIDIRNSDICNFIKSVKILGGPSKITNNHLIIFKLLINQYQILFENQHVRLLVRLDNHQFLQILLSESIKKFQITSSHISFSIKKCSTLTLDLLNKYINKDNNNNNNNYINNNKNNNYINNDRDKIITNYIKTNSIEWCLQYNNNDKDKIFVVNNDKAYNLNQCITTTTEKVITMVKELEINEKISDYEKIKQFVKSIVKKENSMKLYSFYYFKYYELIEKDDDFKGFNDSGFLRLNTVGILNKIDTLIIDFKNYKINTNDIFNFIIKFLNEIKWNNWRKNKVLLNRIRILIFEIVNDNKELYEKSITKLKQSLNIQLYNLFEFPEEWNSAIISLTIEPMKSNDILLMDKNNYWLNAIDHINNNNNSNNNSNKSIATPFIIELKKKLWRNLIAFDQDEKINKINNKNNARINNNNKNNNFKCFQNENNQKEKSKFKSTIINFSQFLDMSNPFPLETDIKESFKTIFESINEFDITNIESVINSIEIFSPPISKQFSRSWEAFIKKFFNNQFELIQDDDQLEIVKNYLKFWLTLNPKIVKKTPSTTATTTTPISTTTPTKPTRPPRPPPNYQFIINYLFKILIKFKGISISELIEIKNQIKKKSVLLENSIYHIGFYLNFKSSKYFAYFKNDSLLGNKANLNDLNKICTFEFIFEEGRSFDEILETIIINSTSITDNTINYLININRIKLFKKYFPIYLKNDRYFIFNELLQIGFTLLKKLINYSTNLEYIQFNLNEYIQQIELQVVDNKIDIIIFKKILSNILGYSIVLNRKDIVSFIINQYNIKEISNDFTYWNNYPMIEYICKNHPNVDISKPFQTAFDNSLPFLSKSIPIFDILIKYKPSLFIITPYNLNNAISSKDYYILNYYFKKGYLDKDENGNFKLIEN